MYTDCGFSCTFRYFYFMLLPVFPFVHLTDLQVTSKIFYTTLLTKHEEKQNCNHFQINCVECWQFHKVFLSLCAVVFSFYSHVFDRVGNLHPLSNYLSISISISISIWYRYRYRLYIHIYIYAHTQTHTFFIQFKKERNFLNLWRKTSSFSFLENIKFPLKIVIWNVPSVQM